MAAGGYPKWLLAVKGEISESKEWALFLRELHDAIQQQLEEAGVQFFSDLSESEKDMFMERATQAIEGGSVYNNLYKTVSNKLDEGINSDVADKLLVEEPMESKPDLLIENCEEGALTLMKKYTEMKSKLTVCLNKSLPLAIRQLAWRLFLTNSVARKAYIDLLNVNPRQAISMYDYEISQRCEQILQSESSFAELRGSTGIFYGMKAVLSYYHAKKKTRIRLRDVDHLLIIPFLQVSAPSIPRREPPSGRLITQLVEQFLTYMESRPLFVIDSGSELHDEEFAGYIDKCAKLLQTKHSETAKLIIDRFIPDKDKIVATETGGFTVLMDGLTTLLRPMTRSMFVGFMKMDTLLYIWDQYMIGLDTPNFGNEWIPVVAVMTIGLLKEKLRKCTDAQQMIQVMTYETKRLSPEQYQYEVSHQFYHDLFKLLRKDDSSVLPVLDPTQALHPPWKAWYNEVIPPFTRPQDRRKAREEREAERERLLQQQRDVEQMKKGKEAREKRQEEEEFLRMAAKDQQLVEQERMKLEDQLDEERRRTMEQERRAQEEIEKIKLQIAALQKSATPGTVVSPVESEESEREFVMSRLLVAPPPSRASRLSPVRLPSIKDIRTPTPQEDPAIARNKIMVDFLHRVAHGMAIIAHGDGIERESLDKDTEGYLKQNVDDIKRAQEKVFGHVLAPGEFEDMDPEIQTDKSEKMLKLMQKWREERAAEELKNGF